jgi:hypothetical protein
VLIYPPAARAQIDADLPRMLRHFLRSVGRQ